MNALFVAVLTWFSVNGCFKGFVKTVFSIFAFGVAIGLAFLLTTPLSKFLTDKEILKKESQSVSFFVLQTQSELFVSEQAQSKEEMIALIYSSQASYFTKSVLEKMIAKVDFSGEFTVEQIVSPLIYQQAIKIFSYLVLFFFLLLMLKILQGGISKFLNFFNLQATDKALGFFFGVLLGVLVYFAVTCLIIFLGNVFASDFLIKKINEGWFSSLIYQNFGNKIIGLI